MLSSDVKTAFLPADFIYGDVLLVPPRGFRKAGKKWKLRKAVYSLKEAARNCYLRLSSVLFDLGLTKTPLYPAVLYKRGKRKGVVVVHVRNILCGGDDTDFLLILQWLKEILKNEREQSTSLKHLRFNIEDLASEVCISQTQHHQLNNGELWSLANKTG